MGSCISFNTAICPPTARLVLEDGRLEEFSEATKVAVIIERNPRSFVCHSDSIDFDEYVIPVPPNEELEVGQLYFLLAEDKLQHPMAALEIVLLAVKANAAMNRSHAKGPCSKIMPLIDDNYVNGNRSKPPSRARELKHGGLYSFQTKSKSNVVAAAGSASVGGLQRVASTRTKHANKSAWESKLPTIDEAVIC